MAVKRELPIFIDKFLSERNLTLTNLGSVRYNDNKIVYSFCYSSQKSAEERGSICLTYNENSISLIIKFNGGEVMTHQMTLEMWKEKVAII